VIACEYASIFAALGCAVTLLDKAAEPLGFLDPPLRKGFLAAFQAMGGKYQGGAEVTGARFDGFSQVEVQVREGAALCADIVFAAFGRIANLEGIGLDRLQLAISSRGHVQVDARYETNIPGIFAAGDAIGPPALACAAADQGRRAALAALGLPPPAVTSLVPSGVYTIPEIACVGLSQSEAAAKKVDLIVGRADFSEVARAHIAGEPVGFLALLCERGTARVLGVQVIGEGCHRSERRFLHRADLQLSHYDRSLPDRRLRRPQTALGAAGCPPQACARRALAGSLPRKAFRTSEAKRLGGG
jgi:NAD(P) transhydrogenase